MRDLVAGPSAELCAWLEQHVDDRIQEALNTAFKAHRLAEQVIPANDVTGKLSEEDAFAFRADLDLAWKELRGLAQSVAQLSVSIEVHAKQVGRLEDAFSRHQERASAIWKEVTLLGEVSLTSQERSQSMAEELTSLHEAVDLQEKQVFALGGALRQLKASFASLRQGARVVESPPAAALDGATKADCTSLGSEVEALLWHLESRMQQVESAIEDVRPCDEAMIAKIGSEVMQQWGVLRSLDSQVRALCERFDDGQTAELAYSAST